MERSCPCSRCTKRSLISDEETGNLICSSCGVVQEFDNFQAHIGGINGPTGTYVRIGTVGTGNEFSYKDNKIYKAQTLLGDIIFKLGLSPSTSNEVKLMVEKITDGEYGLGNWFPIFVGACAYVVMRKAGKSLPMTEVANVIGCDLHELGRMVTRITEFLGLKLPEFDIVNSFERAIRTCPSFTSIESDKIDRMLKQGIFLVQCMILWFVTTGRSPVPVVVAVLVFVAQLNQVKLHIEDVARELCVRVSTCKIRYKELLKKLVEVAQKALPWGNNITVKNVLKNAPVVIQYMEMKSMSKNNTNRKNLTEPGFDDFVGEFFSKRVNHLNEAYDSYGVENHEMKYFDSNLSPNWNVEDLEKLKISHECLSTLYIKFLDEVNGVKLKIENRADDRRNDRGLDDELVCRETEWWDGKSELSKKLFLKKILEKDVGYDPMPPSFVKGCRDYEKRREKIKAAKIRIEQIMNPTIAGNKDNLCVSEKIDEKFGKKRKRMKEEVDWEDFVVETLLLHRVEEEEIVKGHYNALLDLHVFDSGICDGEYCVRKFNGEHWTVNLRMHNCGCGEWQVTGIPCVHVVHLLTINRFNFLQYIDPMLSVRSYGSTYDENIKPIAQETDWPQSDEVLLPPIVSRGAGRPRNNRILGVDERELTEYEKWNLKKCSKCGGFGHNRSCQGRPVAGVSGTVGAVRGGRGSRGGATRGGKATKRGGRTGARGGKNGRCRVARGGNRGRESSNDGVGTSRISVTIPIPPPQQHSQGLKSKKIKCFTHLQCLICHSFQFYSFFL